MDTILLVTVWALVGVTLALAALRVAAGPQLRPAAVRLAGRPELPPGLYASTTAPAPASGGTAGAASSSRPAPPLDPVARRKLLRWVGWTGILLVLGQLAVGFLPFFWPRKVGAFGGRVLAGNVGDYKVGEVKKIVEGKFFISRVPEGFLALWQKCPHLGCAVPWDANGKSEDSIESTGRFNCPCHGSIYDRYGQIIQGPAPRPMDMFRVTIESGRIFVQTGPNDAIKRDKARHEAGGPDGPVPA